MAYLSVKKTVARNPRKKVSRNRARAKPAKARRAAVVREKKRAKRSASSRKHAKRNPVPVLISMGAVNPRKKKGKKSMAKRNTARKHAKKRNPVARKATRKNSYKSRGRRGRRRNPEVFGRSVASGDALKMILGGLIGVTITKTAVGMLPPSLLSNGLVRVVATGALAFAAGALAKQTGLGPGFADAVTFGGLMQAGSTMLTEFVPGGSRLALSGVRRGVGDLVPAVFTTPNNPVKLAAQQAAMAATLPTTGSPSTSVSGIRPVFRSRFGR